MTSHSDDPHSRLLAWLAYPTVLATCVTFALTLLDAGVGAPLATTLAYLLALAEVAVLERAQPRDPAWSPASISDTASDLPYLLSGVLVQRVVGGALVAATAAAALWLGPRLGAWASIAPMFVRACAALLLADLGKYVVHRASHELPSLWRFHAAHHAPDRMYSLNGLRLHPVNVAWNVALEVGFAAALGLDARALAIVGSFRAAVAVLQHANVALRFGLVSSVLSTPELHQWHHSNEKHEADANYGATFAFWDFALGTLFLPRDRDAPSGLGLAEGQLQPRSYWHQLAWPWCEARAASCRLVHGWRPEPPTRVHREASRMSRAARAGLAAALIAALVALAVFGLVPAEVEAALDPTLLAPPYRVGPRALALHRRLFVADLHADTLLWGRDLLARSARGHVDLPRLVEGHVALQALTIPTASPLGRNIEHNVDRFDTVTALAIAERWPVVTWTHRAERVLYAVERLRRAVERSEGRLVLIERAADLDAFLARREREPAIVAAFVGVEGAHALDPDENRDLATLERFDAAGVRMMSLTHFFDDVFGGSAHGSAQGGLTPRGAALVRHMEARHMIVDLAHASPRTIDDVLAIATRPVLVSHTGVRATCDTPRNLSDRQLRAIADRGGLVGIGFFPHALCGDDVDAIARAILHAVDVMGIEHVALGSDFDGATPTVIDASGMALVTEALLARGLTCDEVAAIMGQNTLRFLRAGLP